MDNHTDPSPLAQAREASRSRDLRPLVEEALARTNQNAGRNVYLALDPVRVLAEAEELSREYPVKEQRPPLFGIPVAIKDCFDVAGYCTTVGTRFYAKKNGIAATDSAVAARLRQAGAILLGKTHLHPVAYGITGENPEYGDCLQPRDAGALTGGSSSGSAASVQEGSVVAAIGTDTGGSVRAPAALCGLAGYRSSVGMGSWEGGAHLSVTFDTIGWLFRDLRDGPALASALFGLEPPAPDESLQSPRIAALGDDFLHDCDPSVLRVYRTWKENLASGGASLHTFVPDFWDDALEVFAPIQANDAAALHRGHYGEFEKSIAERLAWGASFTPAEIAAFRKRQAAFEARMHRLFEEHDFLIMPCSPLSKLAAGADHTETRKAILRYTSPASLARVPAVALPGVGGGVQLIGPRGSDARLLAFAAGLRPAALN